MIAGVVDAAAGEAGQAETAVHVRDGRLHGPRAQPIDRTDPHAASDHRDGLRRAGLIVIRDADEVHAGRNRGRQEPADLGGQSRPQSERGGNDQHLCGR